MGDGKSYLSLQPGELVTAVRANNPPGLRSAYDKIRIRRSIEYPVTGVAVALVREGDRLADLRVAFTGTNPRPVLLGGTAALCGGPLDAQVFGGLDALVRDQIMSMKTTFTPGHYRRRASSGHSRRSPAFASTRSEIALDRMALKTSVIGSRSQNKVASLGFQ